MNMEKYSDVIIDHLAEIGYTHCFFLAGGNIMHLLESASRKMTCIPVINEVCAGIAAEYFNESGLAGKAFAMVTAGPGLTNIVTAFGGAFLESRELLVLGGQVKTADLAHGQVRQRGIQEIDGVSIVKPISKHAVRMEAPWPKQTLQGLVKDGATGRKGPVFIEIPLDVQAKQVEGNAIPASACSPNIASYEYPKPSAADVKNIAEKIRKSERPLFLLGGGIERKTAARLADAFAKAGVPVTTTWNGADRMDADHPMYMGRPNTWGQRSANLILQQSDVLIALGTRLGMQQTGFNWQKFAPLAEIYQADVDAAELNKGHPKITQGLQVDANALLEGLLAEDLGTHTPWVEFCREVRRDVPLLEANKTAEGYVSPYTVADELSGLCTKNDVVIPCSSGSAFTVMMQTFRQKAGQVMITDKGSASMGYGLSGAIGAAKAAGGRRTILVEGDGGFTQNLQEIGTAAAQKLNLKIFIFDDHGYASIRSTQKNYFQGRYVGCDIETQLGMPNWQRLFAAWDVPVFDIKQGFQTDKSFLEAFNAVGVAAFIVPVDPEQTHFPRIASRVLPNGSMESNPLHLMTPPLDEALMQRLTRFLPAELL